MAEQKETQAALGREKDANDDLLRALEREQRALYFQRIALAAREIEALNVGRAEELLEECPATLRGWEWHYLKRRCRQEPFTLREHPGMTPEVAVSPDSSIRRSLSLRSGPRPGHASIPRVTDLEGALLDRLLTI